ncbi:MAG: phosphoribosylformylglycinamidine cyclo-ligase [Rhodospirillaceae bacterium]|nr:phosphoribosylformylglycinamidine cyclo-ligase [Rhodospirillaceae bacterium]
MSSLLTYAESGVDIEKGNSFVDIIKNITKNRDIGGFSGIYKYKNGTQLVASTDGVGSKLEICKQLNKYDTIGIDLVAMSVNDIICQGAKPLFFLDYYSTGKLDIERASAIIRGINEGCRQADCILLGGETAEMPTVYGPDSFDLAGFAVGSIEGSVYGEADIFPKKIEEGDLIYGIQSTGIHSNGYTLVNRLLDKCEYDCGNLMEFMEPTKIYVDDIREIREKYQGWVRGFSHITGGGIIDNIPRIFDEEHSFQITNYWEIPKILKWIFQNSDMTPHDMFKTYNCGIGMVVILDKNTDLTGITNMIPMGYVTKDTNPSIDYDKFSFDI